MDFSFIRIAHGSEHYQQTLSLREQVLRQPLGLTLSEQDIDGEAQQLHFALLAQDEVVACVSFKLLSKQRLKLRQMAVDPNFQGQGLGKILITNAEDAVKQLGFNTIQMAAREVAEVFYRKLGYVSQGDYFTEVGIRHILMDKHFTD